MSLPAAFLSAIEQQIPAERCFSDPLSTLTFGTDASFYRLIPKLVIRVEAEAEVVLILQQASIHKVAVTFRAAGTSLSGQAISDSVLIVLGDRWNNKEILDDGQRIRLQPGVIGAHANQALAHLQRKIGLIRPRLTQQDRWHCRQQLQRHVLRHCTKQLSNLVGHARYARRW